MQVIIVKKKPCTHTKPAYWVARSASGIKEKVSAHDDLAPSEHHGGSPKDLGDLVAYRLAKRLGWTGWYTYSEDASGNRYYCHVKSDLYVPNVAKSSKEQQKIPN